MDQLTLNSLELLEAEAFGQISTEQLYAIVESESESLNLEIISDYFTLVDNIKNKKLHEEEEVFLFDMFSSGVLSKDFYTGLVECGYINSERASFLIESYNTVESTNAIFDEEAAVKLYGSAVVKALLTI